MKLNTKTRVLNVISDENLAKLNRFEESTRLASDDSENASQEAVYQLGANHAFSDAIDFVETQDVTKKTAVDGRMLTAVVVVGAVVLFYGPVKRFAIDVKKNYLAKRAAQKRIDDIIKGEVITPDIQD